MEVHRCVVFTRGSGPTALVGGGSGCTLWKGGIGRTSGEEAATARHGEGSNALRLAGPVAERCPSEADGSLGGGRALHLGGPAAVCSEAAGERIRAIGRETSG